MTDEKQGLIEENTFSYEGYQVVRGEFLSRANMPAICFDGARVSVNTACLRKLPEIRYIQFLVNQTERKLALKPCAEEEKDSFMWCNQRDNKLIPRKIACRIFTVMLMELMGWNTDKRYRIIGSVIKANSDHLILFDLNDYETFDRKAGRDDAKATERNSHFPEEWGNSFGLTAEEHEKSIRINLFDDYTVFRLDR